MAYVVQLLKPLYETFGLPYPRASLVVVFILGGLIFAGGWRILANQVKKDLQTTSAPTFATNSTVSSGNENLAITGRSNHAENTHKTSSVQHTATGTAITLGNNSPAITGNGNSVTYVQPTDHTVHVVVEQLSANVQMGNPASPIYESKWRLTLNGVVPSFQNLTPGTVGFFPEGGRTMNMKNWKAGGTSIIIQNASGRYILTVHSGTPSTVQPTFRCEGVPCSGPS